LVNKLLVALLIVAAGWSWAACQPAVTPSPQNHPVGEVEQLAHPSATVGAGAANIGSPIFPGDVIRTDGTGQVRYRINPKVRWCDTHPSSELEVLPSGPDAPPLLRWNTGSSYCVTEATDGEVHLGISDYGEIRLSDPVFGVIVRGPRAVVKVTHGFVEVRSLKTNSGLVVTAGPMQQVVIGDQEDPLPPEPIVFDAGEREIFAELEALLAVPAGTATPSTRVFTPTSPPPPTPTFTVSPTASQPGTPAGVPQWELSIICAGAGAVLPQPCWTRRNYGQNAQVTLTTLPQPGWQFAGWAGSCTGTGTCTLGMDSHKSVAAVFEPSRVNLTVQCAARPNWAASMAGAGRVNGQDCGTAKTYALETPVTLTVAPRAGWEFLGWQGDCEGTGACVLVMDSDKSVTAAFAQVRITLTVVCQGEGAVGPQGCGISQTYLPGTEVTLAAFSQTYLPGTEVTLAAFPKPGWQFSGWRGACSGAGPCTVVTDAGNTVIAVFTPIQFDLTVQCKGEGAVTPVQCGTALTYPVGTRVVLNQVPQPGWEFTGWQGACSGDGSCTVMMDASKIVTAIFAPARVSLTVECSGAGSATPVACGSTQTFTQFSQVALAAVPSRGWSFIGWRGDCSGAGTCVLVMDTKKTVTAVFSIKIQ